MIPKRWTWNPLRQLYFERIILIYATNILQGRSKTFSTTQCTYSEENVQSLSKYLRYVAHVLNVTSNSWRSRKDVQLLAVLRMFSTRQWPEETIKSRNLSFDIKQSYSKVVGLSSSNRLFMSLKVRFEK